MSKPIEPRSYPPVNCVELIVYDNDGPEGIFHRFQFERSAHAVRYIIENYSNSLDGLNFEITNYWNKNE